MAMAAVLAEAILLDYARSQICCTSFLGADGNSVHRYTKFVGCLSTIHDRDLAMDDHSRRMVKCCVDLHNTVKRWNDLNRSGLAVGAEIVNLTIKLRSK